MKLDGAEVGNIYKLCSKIGGDSKEHLRILIPFYQRPYKWTAKYIENLFNDFFQNREDSGADEYFIGSVVLVKSDKSDYYEVVDGQQRITTVFLLNYIKFLLQRSYVEDLFDSLKLYKVQKALEELNETVNMLVVIPEAEKYLLDEFCQGITGKLDELDEVGNKEEKEDKTRKLANKFKDLFGLPLTKDLAKKDIYCSLFADDLKNFLSRFNMTLSYSRQSYNASLKEALGSLRLIYSNSYQPELITRNDIDEGSPIAVYVNALAEEFRLLKERNIKNNSTPTKVIEDMISDIKSMLNSLSFCKILTGNESDAYTLFEVLNDRALVVDDLELVKNMFFKKYCNSSADTDSTKDKRIEKLDELWGNSIFYRTGVTQTQIISYCGSVFLTGKPELVTNKNQRYREALQENYLNLSKHYDYEDILQDFNIFLAVKKITEKANLYYATVYKYALIAENDVNKSIVYKTINLVHAMDYTAVMPALVNVIIGMYIEKRKEKVFDILNFEQYLDELMGPVYKEEYKTVYECAEVIRKAVLLSKDYMVPREIARNIIEHNYKNKFDTAVISISAKTQNKMNEEFFEWTKKWRYGSDKQNFRLKVLFLNLYQTEKENNKLKFSKAKFVLSSDIEVALDHLDAQNKDLAAEEKYFEPEKITDRREDYINSLGNMMILDGHNNGDKNNKPLCLALEYHKKLANHWLVSEIEDMLNDDAYSKQIDLGIEKYRVAKEDFFNVRTDRLQKYFLALINKEKDSSEVIIGD